MTSESASSEPTASATSMPQFPHRIIRASAGSGKTYQLSNRFLGLLCQGAAPESMLATTFTRKAAGEILDRVVLRLAEAATDQAKAAELAYVLQNEEFDQEQFLSLLASFTRNLYRVRISTLDSFFSQIASSFCLELGLSPGWRIIDELEDQRLRTEAIEAVLRNDENREIRRITSLLSKGAASRSIAALIRSTVDSLYEVFQETGGAEEPWRRLSGVKAMESAELRQLLLDLQQVEMPTAQMDVARTTDVELAEQGDWETLLSKGIAKKILEGETKYNRRDIPPAAIDLYQRLLQNAKSSLVGVIIFQTEATYELLARFHEEYRRLKSHRQAWRFEDVARRLSESAAVGATGQMAYRLDSQIDHLLLDEFQDTSPLQWRVLRPFAQRVTTTQGDSFFCVGDVKQAIYGWRGGVAEIFDDVSDELPGLEPLSLAVSYRSAPPVIDAVNEIFTNIDNHPGLEKAADAVAAWRERIEPHSTALKDLAGYVTLESAAEPTDDSLLDAAVDRIVETVAKAPGHSIGVLVRRNATIAQLIHRLQQRGVAASEEGGNPVTDSAAVLLCLALLRLADHPGHRIARFHVASSPLAEVVGLTDFNDAAAAQQVALQIRQDLLARGYGGVIYHWAKHLTPHCSRRELSRLQKLVEMGYDYQQQATLRPRDFIALVEDKRVADPSTDAVRVMTIHQAKGLEFDVVVLPELDVHFPGQSDEFVVHRDTPTSPIDFVCRYANSQVQLLLPETVQQMFGDAIDRKAAESLCVLYVAVTRAVHALHMFIAPSSKSEKRPKKTMAGLLRAAVVGLEPAPPSSTLWETGDPNWFKQSATAPTPEATAPEPSPEAPAPIVFKESSVENARGQDRATPSRMEGGDRVSLAAALPGDDLWALQRGRIVHAWIDQIAWMEQDLPDPTALAQIAKKIGAGPLSIPKLIADFERMLEQPNLKQVLSKAAAQKPDHLPLPSEVLADLTEPMELEVRREQRFAIQQNGRIVQGVIDRLTLFKKDGKLLAVDLVDFKTDEVRSKNALAAKVEYYRPQLEAYRQAIAATFRLDLDRIAARLVFIARDEVIDIVAQQPSSPTQPAEQLLLFDL